MERSLTLSCNFMQCQHNIGKQYRQTNDSHWSHDACGDIILMCVYISAVTLGLCVFVHILCVVYIILYCTCSCMTKNSTLRVPLFIYMILLCIGEVYREAC